MKYGKIVIAGIAVTVLHAIIGMACCGGVFNWVYKLEPTNVWKAMDSAPGAAYFVGSLVLSIILAFVYALINRGSREQISCLKALFTEYWFG